MAIGLDPSRVARVDIIQAPQSAQGRNFGNTLLLGDSLVIDQGERIRDYSGIDDIAAEFGTMSPEYLAALPFFSQSPQPVLLKVGRWVSAPSPAILHGGMIDPVQTLATLQLFSSAGFSIPVNGTAQNVSALNLLPLTNLNGLASLVTAALSGATCTWDAINNRFDVKTTLTGGVTSAIGYVKFTANPSNNATVVVNGTVITFVTSGATGAQINIRSSVAANAAALQAYCATHKITGITSVLGTTEGYYTPGQFVVFKADQSGTAGNSYTIGITGTGLSTDGYNLFSGGGAGATIGFATAYSGALDDISSLIGLTSTKALAPVASAAAESALDAVVACAEISVDWYALYIASANLTDDAAISVASFIEAANPTRIFGATVTDSRVLSTTDTASLGYRLETGNYRRTLSQFSSRNPYAAISIFGRASTINYDGVNTTLTFKFKDEPGITAETLTSSQADALEAKNVNVFVNYSNGTAILEQGVMSDGTWIDEVIGYDWLQNQLQVGRFNASLDNLKIPQTDDGMAILFASDTQVLEQARRNGFVAPEQWNAQGFGELGQGDFLAKGYYIYAIPMRLQSESDRAARKAPLTQIAVKLAGAIHSSIIEVRGNR